MSRTNPRGCKISLTLAALFRGHVEAVEQSDEQSGARLRSEERRLARHPITRFCDEGEQSVGIRVDLKHMAPTVIGKQVTAKVTLREVNGRRFIFDTDVTNEDGVKIGEGMHERALIDIKRFAGSLA